MNELYNKAKQACLNNQAPWMQNQTRFVGNPESMTKVLQHFTPYLVCAYDTLFLETERGSGWVTAIDNTAIRIEYFDGPANGDYEWIQMDTHHGCSNGKPRQLKPVQKNKQ